jgi:hypothetical protein
MAENRPKIRVVDVPTDTTAEQAEQMLSAPYDEGYYLDKLVAAWSETIRVRAIYRARQRNNSQD